MTWQATPKHKLSLAYDYQNNCQCPRSLTAEIAPESNIRNHAFLSPKDFTFVDWTAPLTNRLLLEAGFAKHREHAYRAYQNLYFTNDPGNVRLNAVIEQSNNLTYRAANGDSTDTWNYTDLFRATASYITGAHAFKVGVNLGVPATDAVDLQHRLANELPVQQRRAEPVDAAGDAVPARDGHRRSRGVRAGSLDRAAPDRHCRLALRLLSRLVPGGDHRARRVRADAQPVASRRPRAYGGTTSSRDWAPPTTCSAPARRR